jgi:hypothetical protein
VGAGRKNLNSPALSNLLNDIGKTLRPKVRCVVNPANRGVGLPDVGLFTSNQIKKNDPNPMKGQPPERSVLEVKGPAEDAARIARSEQVARYLIPSFAKSWGLPTAWPIRMS